MAAQGLISYQRVILVVCGLRHERQTIAIQLEMGFSWLVLELEVITIILNMHRRSDLFV